MPSIKKHDLMFGHALNDVAYYLTDDAAEEIHTLWLRADEPTTTAWLQAAVKVVGRKTLDECAALAGVDIRDALEAV